MHLVILVAILQETLVDGVQVDDEEVVPWVHHGYNDGPSLVGAVEGNLYGLARRLKAAANVLDARAVAPPQRGCLANLICCSADPNERCR